MLDTFFIYLFIFWLIFLKFSQIQVAYLGPCPEWCPRSLSELETVYIFAFK